jgi:alkylation response protein AidB-like acyl-CoA dehydrogenase
MDVLLDEDEEMIRDTARRFFDAECDSGRIRDNEDSGRRNDRDLWRQLAELGWLGLALPAVYGGSEAPFSQLELLFEEAGRALAPVPLHPHTVAALTLAEALESGLAGTQAQALLSDACLGDRLLTWAWQEKPVSLGPQAVTLSAVADGNGWRLNGLKRMVETFEISDFCLVAARTDDTGSAEAGLSLFLVAPDTAGVSSTPQLTLAGDHQSDVRFDDVRVGGEALIGEANHGWALARPMLERAVVLNCAMTVGATRRAAERAFDYAKERIAFGQPIGSFQAIQHTCADMITWVDGAELLTREAAWHIGEGLDAALPVAAAKAFTNERCQGVLREANQIHGGYAQVREYDQQLWYRRAAAWSMRLGTSHEHRRTIARAIGL